MDAGAREVKLKKKSDTLGVALLGDIYSPR
jgi:hypothetical protein